MRGADEPRRGAHCGRQPVGRLAHVVGVGLDEQRVIEPAVHVGHIDVAAGVVAQPIAGGNDVVAILLAARGPVVSRGDEADRVPGAVRVHPAQRIADERVPVAHPHVEAGSGCPACASRWRKPAACRSVSAVMGDTPRKSS